VSVHDTRPELELARVSVMFSWQNSDGPHDNDLPPTDRSGGQRAAGGAQKKKQRQAFCHSAFRSAKPAHVEDMPEQPSAHTAEAGSSLGQLPRGQGSVHGPSQQHALCTGVCLAKSRGPDADFGSFSVAVESESDGSWASKQQCEVCLFYAFSKRTVPASEDTRLHICRLICPCICVSSSCATC
jgi:hypothetical protein